MKVALILPGSLWYAPYVRIYTRIFDANKIQYSIISWNREGDDKPEGIQYNVPCAQGHSSAGFSAYRGYIHFIKKTVREQGFDKIIVFGPQMTCLLSSFLLCHFRNRYMIDYRDLSIEQKPGFKQLFAVMLKHSRVNVISSPGFKRCLPKRAYFISHNLDVDAARKAIGLVDEKGFGDEGHIDVLTIGGIRDYSSNIEVVKALANKNDFHLRFVGKGSASDQIKSYCEDNAIQNVTFKGFYQKEEEVGYVNDATFMNIFYPRRITHDTALSNRFYNSLIYRKPMITKKDTIQGDYTEKYGLGVAVADCGNLAAELRQFMSTDYAAYANRCDQLLKDIIIDQEEFESAVMKFVK